jgi:tetratricopeptide (TPR) repeat protein
MNTKLRLLLLLILSSTIFTNAQDNNQRLFNYAVKIESEGKYNDALTIYKNLLKTDSNNINFLTHTSILYSRLGFRQNSEEQKTNWYKTALQLSQKAIKIDNQNANAHYAFAMALGRMSEFASNKTKINNAKQIKTEAELAIQLNPKLAGPYHILGRWNKEVGGFNGFEKAMINTMFGGMGTGSYSEAIKYFQKAILLEPLNSIHYYELAHTYYKRNQEGDKAQAKNWASKCLLIKPITQDDEDTKRDCEKLLKKLN